MACGSGQGQLQASDSADSLLEQTNGGFDQRASASAPASPNAKEPLEPINIDSNEGLYL
jgi:hypothetical protein